MSKYSPFFAAIKQLGLGKEEAVLEFTNGRTDSLRALKDAEYNELLHRLAGLQNIPPGDKMRKNMIGIARSMQWGNDTRQLLHRLDNWCLQKFKKKLMQFDAGELAKVLSIFKKVYADYLKALNK